MSAYKSDFLQVLAERGFIHQVSDAGGLDAKAAAGPITAYVGFDATAPSLHIGNLLTDHDAAMAAEDRASSDRADGRRHQQDRRSFGQGHQPHAADRRADRRQHRLDPHGVLALSRFRRGGAIMANNADWLDQLHYIPFLRDVGRHFTINQMLTFNSVKLRLEREQPLTFLEFNYMILQAYDFVELHKRHGCILQMGGSDQWGNIVNGIDLGRRIAGAELFALTTPLITTVLGRQDGQDRGRRGLAQRRPDEPLRLLAVLAQQRGRRRRPAAQAVHRAAARRDRPACRAQGRRRSTRPRRCSPPRRPRCCTAARRRSRPPKPRGGPSRKARSPRRLPSVEIPRARSGGRPRRARCLRAKPGLSRRTARRAARSRAAG